MLDHTVGGDALGIVGTSFLEIAVFGGRSSIATTEEDEVESVGGKKRQSRERRRQGSTTWG